MATKRMVIVDDHRAFRELLRKALSKDKAIQVVGEAADVSEARTVCESNGAEMVLLDPHLTDRMAVQTLRQLINDLPLLRTLFHTASLGASEIAEILLLRPHGVVHKSSPFSELREAVRAVAQGRIFYCSTAAGLFRSQSPDVETSSRITQRESEVLQLIVDGHSSKQIAGILNLSVRTVESHRTNIMSKLEVHDVVSLTRRALGDGLVHTNRFNGPPPPSSSVLSKGMVWQIS